MLKLVGSLFIIIAGAMAGNSAAVSFRNKLELQRTLLKMYSETAIMLEYSFITLSELIEQLRRNNEYSSLSFLDIDDDTDIRRSLLDKLRAWDMADEESMSILKSFFINFGTTDISGQLSYAAMARARQSEIVERETKQLNKRSRFARTFGVLGGAFAAVMMI